MGKPWEEISERYQDSYNLGEDHGRSTLTADEALDIYQLAWTEEFSQGLIAEHFGVSRNTVSHIKHGRLWTHVTNHEPKKKHYHG